MEMRLLVVRSTNCVFLCCALISCGRIGVCQDSPKGNSPTSTSQGTVASRFIAARPADIQRLFGGEIRTKVYRLQHARAADISEFIRPLLSPLGTISTTPGSAQGLDPNPASPPVQIGQLYSMPDARPAGQHGLLEDTGGDTYAQREIVFVRDYESVLQQLESLVEELDAPPRQVLIEATLISLQHFGDTDIGFNYAVLDGAGQFVSVVGSGAALNDIGGFSPIGNLVTSALAAELRRGREDAPGGTYQTQRRGFDTFDHGFSQGISTEKVLAFVRALREIGNVEILSSPRLRVVNRQKAEVLVGRRTPYKTVATSAKGDLLIEQVNYLESGTRLRLRPFISENLVRLEVHPERSVEFTSSVNELPGTEVSTVTTNVMVPDRGMVVIGGLIENEETEFVNGIPVLMDLPWIGGLFRETQTANRKTELIILLRPTILDPYDVDRESSKHLADTANWRVATTTRLPIEPHPAGSLHKRPQTTR